MEEKPYETVNAPPAQVPPPTYPAPAPVVVTTAGLSDNAAGAIAYITIIPAIIFLVMPPYNQSPTVRFHAWQSIFLNVFSIVMYIVLAIIGFKLFDFITPFNLEKEMCENKNVAVGILCGGIVLGICWIVAASMS